MTDFVISALPMIVLLVAVAVWLLKVFENKMKKAKGIHVQNFTMLGMFAGAVLGIIVGLLVGNVSLWVAPGIMTGVAIGSCIEVEVEP